MKKKGNLLLLITIVILFISSCKAQTIQLEKPLYSNNEWRTATANTYFKDFGNDLVKLVGTWVYTENLERFEISLALKEQYTGNLTLSGLQFDQDMLYGEYKYNNEQGEELLKSLGELQSSTDPYEHLIKGNYITNINNTELCETCTNELAVKLHIEDPQRDYIPYRMYIQHIPANSQGNPVEQIKLVMRVSGTFTYPLGELGDDRIRLGFYTLNKVE